MKTKIINCNNKKVKDIEVQKRTVKNKGRVYTGTIYPDFSTRHKSTRGIRFVKGVGLVNMRRWCGEITYQGVRYRIRNTDRRIVELFISDLANKFNQTL